MTQLLSPSMPAPPSDLKEAIPPIVRWANDLVISTAQDYESAAEHLRGIKGAMKRVTDWFKPLKQNIDQAKKRMLDMERDLSGPLAEAEALAKSKMLAFTTEQERIAAEHQRKLQAEADERARKDREKAEQAAAEQRRREAEAREKAEAARIAAEQADESERKRLLAEADAAERKANAAAVKAQEKEDTAQQTVAPVIRVEADKPKVSGQSFREVWKAEIIDRSKLLDFIVKSGRTDLIIVNEKVIDTYAKSMREAATMPGVRFFKDRILASRGA